MKLKYFLQYILKKNFLFYEEIYSCLPRKQKKSFGCYLLEALALE